MSDSELIENCKAGDPDAWRTLVERYSKRVFNIVFQFTSQREDSEDLTQEIFIKVFQSLKKFNPETSFVPWLIRITKNYCIDNYRVRKRFRQSTDGENVISYQKDYTYYPYKSLLEKERAHFIMKGVQSLTEDLKTAIILRDIQGFNYCEIAEVLGIPEGTVKSRINRARIELATTLRKMKGFKVFM